MHLTFGAISRWICILIIAQDLYVEVDCVEENGRRSPQVRLKRVRKSVDVNYDVEPTRRQLTQGTQRSSTMVLPRALLPDDTLPVWSSIYPWWHDMFNFTLDDLEDDGGVGGADSSHGYPVSVSLPSDSSDEAGNSQSQFMDNDNADPEFGDGDDDGDDGDDQLDDIFDLGRTMAASRTGSISRYLKNKKNKNKRKQKKTGSYRKTYVPLKSSHKRTILRLHNRFRSDAEGGASNMEKLEYDTTLETMARMYAKTCRWEHGQVANISPYVHVGQNLAYGIGREFTPFYLTRLWHMELLDYNISTGYCTPGQPCGHYTQIVWSTTKFVGCETNFCKNLYDPSTDTWFRNALFLVCNYGPGGNYEGEAPYKIGKPCTECTSWSGKCQNGLCSDCDLDTNLCECAISCYHGGHLDVKACRCICVPGWTGPQCNTPCVNRHSFCGDGNGWPRDWCFRYEDDNPVEELCPALCGVCDCGLLSCANGGTEDPDSCECDCVDPWTGPTCTDCSIECEHGDLDSDRCLCQCHAGWMGRTCSEPCANSHSLCYNGWYHNWCDEEHSFVLQNCKAMCGLCEISSFHEGDCSVECENGGVLNMDTCECLCPSGWNGNTCSELCRDAFVHCQWSKGLCLTNPDFARNYCPLSCGYCLAMETNNL